jgi:hypothetical protein
MKVIRFDWKGFEKQSWFGYEVYLEFFSKKQLRKFYRLKLLDYIQELIIHYYDDLNMLNELIDDNVYIHINSDYLPIFNKYFKMKFDRYNKFIHNKNISIIHDATVQCIKIGNNEIIIDNYLK